jgi:hypothetical protein
LNGISAKAQSEERILSASQANMRTWFSQGARLR